MELLLYSICLGIIFLGLISGVIIAFFTKEELKGGKKYFKILQILISAFIIFLYLSNLSNKKYYLISLMFLFGLPTGTLIIYDILGKKKIKFALIISYILIYISFIILSALLFI